MLYRIQNWYKNFLHHIVGDWNYFLYDESFHERHVIRHFYNQPAKQIPSSKTVIYMANGFCNHAGLCDRLKGITTLYGWCKEYDIDFRIFHIQPFNLHEYLIPNQYEWRIDAKDICYDKNFTSVNHLMLNNLVRKQIDSGEIAILEKKWFLRRIKTKKRQIHFYTNMQPESALFFGRYFQELFKPSPKLGTALASHLKAIGTAFISISFRFVQLLGDFKDCDGDTLSADEQEELLNKSIRAVEEIKQKHKSITKVLVTADSSKFLARIKMLPYVYIIEGKIGHINFENSDDVNMKTFLDFLMIANAQKVYLAKSEKMYNSDFARRAAMIYNRPFELFNY